MFTVTTMTIAEAIKHARTLSRHYEEVVRDEEQRRTVLQANDKIVTPKDYDFGATQTKLDIILRNIIVTKHAINAANVTEVIPELGMTADKVLIKMAMLSSRIKTLRAMIAEPDYQQQPFSGAQIVLARRNYEIEVVREAERDLSAELATLQAALDRHNLECQVSFPQEEMPADAD